MKAGCIFAAAVAVALSGAGQQKQGMAMSEVNAGKGKTLIVYFSHSGNTREIAKQMEAATGADVFEVTPVKPYPKDYDTVVAQAKIEVNKHFKPDIQAKVSNLAQYDTILLGSPCWWGTIAPPLATFLTLSGTAGKTIAPFMTHEGSRMGRSVEDIRQLCPQAKVLEGLPIRGGKVKSANAEVIQWLKKNNLMR